MNKHIHYENSTTTINEINGYIKKINHMNFDPFEHKLQLASTDKITHEDVIKSMNEVNKCIKELGFIDNYDAGCKIVHSLEESKKTYLKKFDEFYLNNK